MDNLLQDQTEAEEVKHERSSDLIDGMQTNGGKSMPIKDADTTLSMIVLLLACLALAALAHVIV